MWGSPVNSLKKLVWNQNSFSFGLLVFCFVGFFFVLVGLFCLFWFLVGWLVFWLVCFLLFWGFGFLARLGYYYSFHSKATQMVWSVQLRTGSKERSKTTFRHKHFLLWNYSLRCRLSKALFDKKGCSIKKRQNWHRAPWSTHSQQSRVHCRLFFTASQDKMFDCSPYT